MPSRLASIPSELFREIISLLLLPDQAALGRTCKSLNRLLTPVIWSDIELHHNGTHEGIDIEGEIASFSHGDYEDLEERMADLLAADPLYPHKRHIFEPTNRKYAQCDFNPSQWQRCFQSKKRRPSIRHARGRATDNCNRRNFQFGREEKFVGVRNITSPERWNSLARYVRSLCMSIGVDGEVVEVISSFTNLRSLELIGLPLENGHAPIAPAVVLSELQNLKLRGYFSAALVRKLCSNAKNITHLNLGLLATSIDDEAYKDSLLANDDSWALVSEKEVEHYQQNGAETAATAEKAENNAISQHLSSGEESEDSSDDESFDDDTRPWALHGPIWLPRSLPAKLISLTHLHLVKPYTGETAYMFAHDHFRHIPHRYEQILCMEWGFLLEAVAGTLKELILEHRIPMEVGDTVGDGDPHPEVKGSNRLRTMGSHDRGDELFCRSVLRILIERSHCFSNLRRLAIRGIQVKSLPLRPDDDGVPGKDGLPDNEEILRKSYPDCDIEIFENAYPIHVYAGYVYQSWPDDRHEAMQDQGDGLLYNLSYFHDYKKRFGPQWMITD
jgi:hypothetical protein